MSRVGSLAGVDAGRGVFLLANIDGGLMTSVVSDMNGSSFPGPDRKVDLLPIVRAAMARGEGPAAVVAWIRRQGHQARARVGWTRDDEIRARILARQLTATLSGHWENDRRRANLGTELGWNTLVG